MNNSERDENSDDKETEQISTVDRSFTFQRSYYG